MRILGFLMVLFFIACTASYPKEIKALPLVETPEDLGKLLFFDPILSQDQTIACASCHQPQFAFADSKAFSEGVGGKLGARNAPSVMNMASRSFFFHDGRAGSLEEQARFPIEDAHEMNMDFEEAVKRVQAHENYSQWFFKLYGEKPDSENIVNALAQFQKSLESDGSAPHDQWMNDEDPEAMSTSQIRGRAIFLSDRARCFDCHFGPDFTGDEFKNIGLYDGHTLSDKGRWEATHDSEDIGKFKVPGLRNVALTAPYMHNGMFKTLEEVIDYYSNPYDFVQAPIGIDETMVDPIHFTEQEKKDLVAFLHSLTDENIPHLDQEIQHIP